MLKTFGVVNGVVEIVVSRSGLMELSSEGTGIREVAAAFGILFEEQLVSLLTFRSEILKPVVKPSEHDVLEPGEHDVLDDVDEVDAEDLLLSTCFF